MPTRWHWAVALAVATFLHLAAIAAWQSRSAEGALDDGEQGVEIGLGLLGDLGEADQDVAPTPAVSPPPPEEVEPPPEQVEPPPEQPQPPEQVQPPDVPPPEQVLPPPEQVKPQPPAPRRTAVPEIAPVEAPAAPPTPPRLKRGTGRASALAAGASPGATLSYAARLAAHLNRHKRYPLAARRRREEGVVELRLLIARDGTVISSRVSRPGPKALSEAALRMLEEAKPLPPFPDGMTQSRIDVVVPISFKLREI